MLLAMYHPWLSEKRDPYHFLYGFILSQRRIRDKKWSFFSAADLTVLSAWDRKSATDTLKRNGFCYISNMYMMSLKSLNPHSCNDHMQELDLK